MATLAGWYGSLRKLFGADTPYRMLWPTCREVVEIATEAGLRPVAQRRHACPLPGSRLLGQALQERYLKWSCRSALARHGCEVVVLFVKEPTAAGDGRTTLSASAPAPSGALAGG